MSQYCLLLPTAPTADDPVEWCLLDADGRVGDHGEAPAGDLATRLPRGARVWLLLPPGEVSVLRATLPTRNRQRARQALPWALEDQLAADPDRLHFALGRPEADGRHSAAVIDRERMATWLHWAAEQGLELHTITPLELAIGAGDDDWRLILGDQAGWLSTGPRAGLALEADAWPLILPRLLAQAQAAGEAGDEGAPAGLALHPAGAAPGQVEALRAALPDTLTVSEQPAADSPLRALAPLFDPHQAINLLQGPFSGREQWLRRLRPWRAVAALALAWVGLQFVMLYAEVRNLERTEQALRAETVEIFRDTFPDSRVVNPRVQMERALAELDGGGEGGPERRSDPFIAVLNAVAPALTGDDAPRLRSLAFRQQRLELDLDAASVQALERLREAVEARGDWQVQIHSAASRGERIAGRVTIQREEA
ncbi:type II secretion system protein GspL [Alkalilimnicola ehrlichii MLHE-1]|uniref:Type II secretion system protein L n=1 Tax=Alkalilimnicola ehrlichii (strain ATCC BAA-1101 / DSM 17681 / MLHE-1) TaxID=187272 RepID=Q0A612_ALKEH|nr:type II secretion system protein GspL [Alkalilimnicola ehrlichii]ABI57725.1 general secretion pathway protein L [Alkalilimnicola ehrlichii MLHE-1]